MFYSFPAGLSLDEVRDVISKHNDRCGLKAFIEADKGSYVVFNYVAAFESSFPHPSTGDPSLDREYAILRECRGLTFCKHTRQILARKWHKFFNVNEKPETQLSFVDWGRPHQVLEKLDGSMLVPMNIGELRQSNIRWATKMGLTEVARPVEDFVQKNPQYNELAVREITHGYTPIFEWCSRKQKIVIDYPEDRLVLTGIRDNETGEYCSYERMEKLASNWDIPVVQALPGSIENIQEFMAQAHDLEGAEGYVIRFDNGHNLKVKGEWYCRIHKTKEMLNLEKDVWSLILEDRLDDAKSFMDDADRERVDRYHRDFRHSIDAKAKHLFDFVENQKVVLEGDRKRFALEAAPMLASNERAIAFQIWEGRDPQEAISNFLKKHTGTSTRVEEARAMVSGLRWDDYRDRNLTLDD